MTIAQDIAGVDRQERWIEGKTYWETLEKSGRGGLHVKFIVLFGPPAVGKMTVGYELEKLTGLRLFHNHMTIDLVLHFFEFGSPPFGRLVNEFRTRIFEEVAAISTSTIPTWSPVRSHVESLHG